MDWIVGDLYTHVKHYFFIIKHSCFHFYYTIPLHRTSNALPQSAHGTQKPSTPA